MLIIIRSCCRESTGPSFSEMRLEVHAKVTEVDQGVTGLDFNWVTRTESCGPKTLMTLRWQLALNLQWLFVFNLQNVNVL